MGHKHILHLLNRAAFGPRPGDVARVREEGIEVWVERQLHPETIPDSAVDKLLEDLPTLGMSSRELLVAYPPPQLLRGISRRLASQRGMDPDAVRDLFPELEEMRRRQEMRESMSDPGAEAVRRGEGDADRMARAMSSPNRIVLELSQAKLLRAVYSERQLQEVMTDFWFNHFNVYIGKGADRWLTPAYERDAIRPRALGNFRDLLGATARHPAMLFYLDNWLSAAPNTEVDNRTLEAGYARAMRAEGIEPYGVALEILRDRGIDTQELEERVRRQQAALARGFRGTARNAPRALRRDGLNENYARELLELHTLGVDGGYTQQDIIEIARCFTGWTLMPSQHGRDFVYIDALHDNGSKKVLGKKIKGGGMKEGEAVLDLLASHPSTARLISYKLAQRFVSDEPPGALVTAMAETFRETGGDIRAVMRTLLISEQFWAPEAVGAKMKTPFEFVASALRATDAEIASFKGGARPGAVLRLRELGQPLYAAQPPTGYKNTADAWVSTGALLGRMKIALGLAAGRVPGVSVEIPRKLSASGSTTEILSAIGERLMGREPSEEVLAALTAQIDDTLGGGRRQPPVRAVESLAVGWILASAEFQRR